MKRLVFGLLPLFLSCKTSPDSKTLAEPVPTKPHLSLNDVPILMPLLTQPALIGMMPRISDIPDPAKFAPGLSSAPLDNQPFVPTPVFKQIADLLKKNRDEITAEIDRFNKSPGGIPANAPPLDTSFSEIQETQLTSLNGTDGTSAFADDIRMVSLRIDPCVNIMDIKGDDGKCVMQLRLNFQIVKETKGRANIRDYNIHAIYELTPVEFEDIVTTMRKLAEAASIKTLALPLLPHPVINNEGPNSPYLAGVLGIVHRFARASKMTNLAFLADTAPGLGGHWPMVTAIVKDGQATFINIPSTRKGSISTYGMVQRMGGHGISLDPPVPSSMSKWNLYSDKGEMTTLKNAFLIEHPFRNDATRTDCASCHTAMMEKKEAYRRLTQKDKNVKIDMKSEAFTSRTWDLSTPEEYSDSETPKEFRAFRDGTSLQMFSYFLGKTKITQRVINESAVVADFINKPVATPKP